MKMKAFLASMAALVVASTAQAATISYTLSLNDNGQHVLTPGSFAVYASVNVGDNAGLAAFTYGLSGITAHLNTFDPDDPTSIPDPIPTNPVYTAPVTTYRNSAGTIRLTPGYVTQASGGGALQQTGSQDTTGTASNIRITYGVGQTATTLVPYSGTSLYDSGTLAFAPLVLLSTGTFTASENPVIGPGNATTGGNVFNLAQNKSTFAALGAYQTVNLSNVPEPTSIAVLGLGGISLLARRRKAVTA